VIGQFLTPDYLLLGKDPLVSIEQGLDGLRCHSGCLGKEIHLFSLLRMEA